MTGAGAREEALRYRLRGEVGGVERTYPVEPGESRIGSVGDNEVVLPVRGVSRRHALLRLGPDGLSLEDVGSKNGVIVNGVRVQRTRLSPEDEIRLGPVALRLEVVPADDTELAIVAGAGTPPEAGLPSWQTTAVTDVPGAGRGGAWLKLLEGVVERLCVVPEGDLTGALALLVREIQARGACLVEGSEGPEPVVLAATGDLKAPALQGTLKDLFRAGEAATALVDGDPPLACAVLSGREAEPLGLVVWGPFRDRSESGPLLKTLLLLFRRFRPRPVRILQGRPSVGARELIFPEGYVPGESPATASLYGQMKPLLQGDLPVLILGETGVGKECVARILHASSARAKGPFVAVNCAAIPSELLEAEMFGIGKGVATGVVERQGKFQHAGGGTLFLDEIGDMSLDLQAKLLRALQEKEIQPVGSAAPVPVDIRVVTATNTDLERRLEEGRFRRDLYYRVAGYVLRAPPLRERKDDVPALVEAFVRAFSRDTGKSIRGVTVKALRALTEYRWPGNIRELEHEVRRIVYLCPDGEAIDSAMLSAHVLSPAGGNELRDVDVEPEAASLGLEGRLQKVEDRLIRQALARAGGNRTQAAKLLGISRNGLAIKMQRLGISD